MSKYFKPQEFRCKDGSVHPVYAGGVRDDLLLILDEIRERFGKPVIVNSGYRSPEHNARVGGVPNSFHIQGMAADIRPEDLKDLPKLYAIANEVNSTGGVGKYKTFVHVDVGPARRWNG